MGWRGPDDFLRMQQKTPIAARTMSPASTPPTIPPIAPLEIPWLGATVVVATTKVGLVGIAVVATGAV
jgi:hypothetical protein